MISAEPQQEGIAIIGLAGRFPGARNIAEFWDNLIAGRESITRLSDEELSAAGFDARRLRADPSYVAARGLIERPEWFDAAFFGITPKEAEVMDPQQRVFLEEAWTALEDAGCDPAQYPGAIGVFAGMSNNSYFAQNVADRSELIEAVGSLTAMMGNEKDYLATRVAYKLNLRGPALNIYTACSTSLVAVCQACTALLTYQCDAALAGGISITFPQHRGYQFQDGGITSPDGHCRAFDAQAAGTVFSSGVGVVVLKRLSDALAEGDQIYAVIKGAALNNDGSKKVSFTAPSVDGHAEVIALAQALAGFAPETISYIEAHGTGTPLGDPIEIVGLTQAFRAGTEKTSFCAIGSVKTNIGHLDAAAGIAGLIKTALALKHGVLPPTLHFTAANPKLELAGSPFYVQSQLGDWNLDGLPRRAGVSSFGVGGTNAHVVLEEAPVVATASQEDSEQLLVLSARTPGALEETTRQLAERLDENPELRLGDVASTLQTGRRVFNQRRIVVAVSIQDAVRALRDSKRQISRVQANQDVPVVFMFPGQGAQYPGMGAQLYRAEPFFRETVDRCADLLRSELDADLRELLFSTAPEAAALLQQTRLTQPALFVIGYALTRLWISRGIQPAALIGHSVGEYVAACLADVFSLEDAVRLVAARARLVQAQPGGAMLAVRLGEAELAPLLTDELSIAAINSARLCVASGPFPAIEKLEAQLRQSGTASRRLSTSHAFHSAMMDAAVGPFTEIVRSVRLHRPKIRFVSNVTADWITDAQATDPAYWGAHMRQPVRFSASLVRVLERSPIVLLESGPGETLSTLARQHPAKSEGHSFVASLPQAGDENTAIATALGRLWLAGVNIDWTAVHRGRIPCRISLPTYPFERQRYWAEPARRTPSTPVIHPIATPVETGFTEREGPLKEGDASPLVADIVAVFSQLSGIELSSVDPSTNFLELGFDSLFLTQASLALQKRFRVPVTFRRLLEETPSALSLAQWLEAQLPKTGGTSNDAGGSRQSSAAATSRMVAAPTHGPFRRIDTAAPSEFTPAQQKHLEELIARYTTRTPGSKRLTALHRQKLADPRAVAGFRRAWKEMVYPVVSDRSLGSKIWDVDGNEYVDITLGFGQNLLGHRPPFVVEAIQDQLLKGMEIGPTSPLAGEVAALVCAFTGMERAAFCNTGSEAVTAALRVARTVTGRSKIALFAGAYHGIFDEVLVRPQTSDGRVRAYPIAPGIEPSALENVLILDYGSDEALETLRAHADEIAAVLIEPVQSRRPELQPRDFLHAVRELTASSGTALVFDEVVTGFRIHPGGAQAWFGVQADIGTYGKVIGGGLPIGIVAGSARFMDALDGGQWSYGDDSFPEVGVTFFAGTFVRHPLALAAARAVLLHLQDSGPGLQEGLTARTTQLVGEMNAHLMMRGVPLRWTQFASMYYLGVPPEIKHASLLWFHWRARGIHAWENRPSFLSTAHSEVDLARVLGAFKESVDELVFAGFLPAKQSVAAAGDISADFPLTPGQQELLLADRLGPEASSAFNDSVTISLRGRLDVKALQEALNELIGRHEALRTNFAPDGETQSVAPSIRLELPEIQDVEAMDTFIERETSRPFDLEQAPLLRAQLLRIDDERHDLILTAHHIVCDGWSFSVIANELAILYSARVSPESSGKQLHAAFPFRQYAEWLSQQQERPDFRVTEQFWLAQFAEPVPPLELPTDHQRPAIRSYRGARRITEVSPVLYSALKRLSAQHRSTLFSTMLAAFHVLLHRLTGQKDLVVGIAAAGQMAIGQNELVGHCVNFLPIRARVTSASPFADFLTRIQSLVLSAYEHQNYTFGTLIQKLALPRDASRMPLLGATFNMDRSATGLSFAGLNAEFDINPKSRLGLELSFNLIETEKGCQLYCAFNRDLFEPTTIDRWLSHYLTLLDSIITDPLRPVSQLPVLKESERRQLLVEWNDTTREFPSDQTIDGQFRQWVAKTPDAIALVDGARQVSYRELNIIAGCVAEDLRQRGVTPGDFVGLPASRNVAFVATVLGILRAGGAYVPLSLDEPQERLETMRKGCRAFLEADEMLTFNAIPPAADRASAVCEPECSDRPAYVLYTSGSTGVPKGVVVPHRAITRLVVNSDYVRFRKDDVVAFASNLCFDATTFELWGALLNGATLVITPQEVLLSPERLSLHLATHQITTLFLTTALFNQLAHQQPAMFRGLRNLIFGGEAADPQSVALVLQHGRPERLLNSYGPTETTTFAVCHVVEEVRESRVPIGRPIANTTAFVLDGELNPVPIGVTGELYIGGPGVALGYYDAPEMTAARFPSTPYGRLYKTGDLVRWRPEATLDFVGRIDEQIKIRGFRIEPGEIVAALQQHPSIVQCAVVPIEDGVGTKTLAAYAVATSASHPEISGLREFLRRSLPDHMIPSRFIFVEKLPLTANGKIDLRALPIPQQYGNGAEFVAPRNADEERVAEVWRHVLKLEAIGVHEDFFHLGGHSLAAMQVVSRLRDTRRPDLSVRDIFEQPTIAGLAAAIARTGVNGGTDAEPREEGVL